MENKAIYTSGMRELVVAFQDIIAHNAKNQPIPRKSVKFSEGMLYLDLTREDHKELEKLLDNHPMNTKNGGSMVTGFRKQKEDITKLKILADGEVYCTLPDDDLNEADEQALEILVKRAKVLPPTALKNTIDTAIYVYNRFGFAGIPKPKKGQKLNVIKARVTEMVEALIDNKIWTGDGSTQGETTSGSDSPED